MLKFFRDQKDSWFVKGILILTALSFMSLFGIQGTAGLRQSNKTVFKTNGVTVSAQQFLTAFDARVNEQRALTKTVFTLQDALNAGMLPFVLNDLVSKTVANEAVDTMNIGLSDDTVRQNILNNPIFNNYDGSFNRSAYQEYLRQTGKTEKTYVADLKNRLRGERLFGITVPATVIPDTLAALQYKVQKEKRSADIIRINEADMIVTEKPTEKEIAALYDEMSDKLTDPEYRKLSVMALTLDDVQKNIPVTDDELKDLYVEHKDRYVTEEMRTVNQMLFDNENDAQEAYQAVKKGKSFLSVAQTHAHQNREQTELGTVLKAGLLAEIADPVFEAKKGDVLAPVQTAFGWQVLQVTGISPRKVVSFKNAKAELAKEFKNLRAYDKLMDLSVRIEDMLGEGKSLEDVAAENHLTIQKIGFTDMAGMTETGEKSPVSQEVLSVAFVGEENQTSPMIEQDNGYVTVRVDEIRDPQMKSLNAARKELVTFWTAEKRREKATKKAEDVLKALKKGQKTADVAQKNGLKVEKMTDFDRQSAPLPPAFVTALFNLKKNDATQTAIPDGFLIAKVTKIDTASPEGDDIGLWEVKQLLAKKTANEKADILLQDFAAMFKTNVNQETVREIEAHLRQSAGTETAEE